MKTILFSSLLSFAVLRLLAQDLSAIYPALKTLPAPASIAEGLRLSYYSSIGDIPDADYNKWGGNQGEWDYATAPSGHGYTQLDVIALSQGIAALTVQAWQYSDWTGPLVPIRGGQSGLLTCAGGGDWWVHPQVLAQIQETQSPEFTILKVIQVLDGRSYPAIRIQHVTDTNRQATVYDLSTGLLLFKGTAVKTAHTIFASQMFYRGSRILPFAAHPQPVPIWINPGLRLDYQGQYYTQVAGSLPAGWPLDALIEIRAVGDGWFLYDQTTTISGIPGLPPSVETSTLVGGGNLYVAPSVLKALQAGAVLDTDPITGCQLSVTQTGNNVTLRSTVGTVSATEFQFDAASGLMNGFRSWDSMDPILQTASELKLIQWPDFAAAAAPTLLIERRGQNIVLSCRSGGGRVYPVEFSVDGGAWQTCGQLSNRLAWEMNLDLGRRCVLFRLRP
jgi:hypothetical protein